MSAAGLYRVRRVPLQVVGGFLVMGKGLRARAARVECQGDLTGLRRAPLPVPREMLRLAQEDGDQWWWLDATPGERARALAYADASADELEPDELLHDLHDDVAEVRALALSIDATVARLRRARVSWAEIGLSLGVTRQTAWERYRSDADRPGLSDPSVPAVVGVS